MRTLTAAQRSLAASRGIRPIVLLVLTTYSDRALETVDTVYYLSDRPVLYDYGNTGTVRQFEALVLSVSDLTVSMPHVPGTTPSGLETELRVTLSNLPYRGGVSFVRELRAHNLEFATVELATVYGPLDVETGWYDLRAYTGDEHIVELRAEVQMAEGIDAESFQIRLRTPEVPVPWVRADDATITDPKDLGARLPWVYGSAHRVPCINWQVGWATTITGALVAAAGAGAVVFVTEATGFPTAAFTARLNGEELAIAARGAAADPLVVAARGQSGTVAVDHEAGSLLVEVPAATVIALAAGPGEPASQLTALYVRNPYNGELFKLGAVPQPVLEDAATAPGHTLSTVTFDAAAMRQLMAEAFASAAVTQQAEYATSGTTATQSGAPSGIGSLTYQSGTPTLGQWYGGTYFSVQTGSPGSPRWEGGSDYRHQWYSVLTCHGFPDVASVSIQLVGNVTHNLQGCALGPFGLWFFGSEIPFVNNFMANATAGVNGSTPIAQAIIQTGGTNFASYNGRTIKVQPIVMGSVVNDSAHYIGFSNLEIRVTYQVAPDVYRTVDARITAAGVGYGLDFYADLDGPTVPPSYTAGYGFEETSGWNTDGCTVASDTSGPDEGTYSLRVTPTVTTIDTCETLDWASYGGAGRGTASLATEHSRGTYSIKLSTLYDGTNNFRGLDKTFGSPFSLTGKLFAFDFRIDEVASWQSWGLGQTAGFQVWLSTSGNLGTDYRAYSFGLGTGIVPGAWSTIVMDPASWPYMFATLGSTNLGSISYVLVGFWAVPNVGSGATYHIDAFRSLPVSCTAQRNATTGTVDLTADGAQYRVATKETGGEAVASVAVYASNTAGSGTTPPAARRVVTVPSIDLGAGAFEDLTTTAADVGSPAVTDCETVGVTVTLQSMPTGGVHADPVVWVDNLRRRDDTGAAYTASVGALIEHPADVVRHLLTERCGLAATHADATTLTAWGTNAPAVALSADLRALGDGLPELLARIGYEGRANIVRGEAAASSTYRALAAEADYTWPASSGRALTQYEALSEVGRDGREIATRFQFLYARDPSRGTDLAAYDGILRANPTVSDVSVSAATLAAREQKYGRRDADTGVLLAHHDEASAADVAGYYITEAGRDAGTFLLRGCAWWEAADIELGDLLDISPPWRVSAIKVRAIEIVRNFSTWLVDIRAVEVT